MILRNEYASQYFYYLRFQVTARVNNLLHLREYTEEQQKTHNLIKSLHDGGMGYRRIAKHFNEFGVRTVGGKIWSNSSVHSILKRHRQRIERIAKRIRNKKHEPVMSKMWLEYS